jgi:threonine dehydrogenase-like Zn-dependent dehydrogenase
MIPKTQHAVQLVGPGQLALNKAKPVGPVGPYTILARTEAVGLCFSDLKVMKQFAAHPRKSGIIAGIPESVLGELSGYAPFDAPTVPGHEAALRIVAVGDKVRRYRVGERVIVQADYRSLKTAASNAAFGYNFEGALQEYVSMDERVMIDGPSGERFLIAAPEGLSASALALVEPWACVEASYVGAERQSPSRGGRMLVVADAGRRVEGLARAFAKGSPGSIAAITAEGSQLDGIRSAGVPVTEAGDVRNLPDESFDDIIYFGACAETVEALGGKLAARGIINIATGPARFGAAVKIPIGRVHYGMTRWVGTQSLDAADGYSRIPVSGEIRSGDRMMVIGAGGPMGQMHVIRCVSSGVPGIEIVATDVDDARLRTLKSKVAGLVSERAVKIHYVNTAAGNFPDGTTYVALMAPAASLVARAIATGGEGCLINIFAGIPAPTIEPIDLDAYIERGMYMTGSSGSVISDMELVLAKVANGGLDTNSSVDAISGMAGALDGLGAVENRTLAGKIVVYPEVRDLGLIRLADIGRALPRVATKLQHGNWTKAAEDELLRGYAQSSP